MQKNIIKVTITILFLFTILGSASAATGDKFISTTGNDSNTGDSADNAYLTIQKGLDNVANSGTVNIAAGTYTGAGNTNLDVKTAQVTIKGSGQNKTIIDGAGTSSILYVDMGENVTIKDLTMKNGTSSYTGGAINNAFGTLNVVNTTFTSNTAMWGGAIFSYGPLTVISSTFNSNIATAGGGAIAKSDNILNIIGSNFYDNTVTVADFGGGAIFSYTYGSGVNTNVKYSRFVGNTVGNNPNDIYLWSAGPSTNILDATLNWWGSNNEPAGRINGNSYNTIIPAMYNPWLVMSNPQADPSTIYTGKTSKISVNVYTDSSGVDHSADAGQFFSGPQVTFTTNLGNVGSKQITVPWTMGMAFAILRGDEGPGVATVTAADGNDPLSTTVTILQAPPTPGEVNAATTVGMQETGIPIAMLILAVLAVLGGFATQKRE